MNRKKKITIIIMVIVTIIIIGMIVFVAQKPTKESLLTTYKITLDVNGRASVLETDEYGMLEEPDEPYRPGGKFLGWYIGEEKVDFSKPFTENSTIRAKWE